MSFLGGLGKALVPILGLGILGAATGLFSFGSIGAGLSSLIGSEGIGGLGLAFAGLNLISSLTQQPAMPQIQMPQQLNIQSVLDTMAKNQPTPLPQIIQNLPSAPATINDLDQTTLEQNMKARADLKRRLSAVNFDSTKIAIGGEEKAKTEQKTLFGE